MNSYMNMTKPCIKDTFYSNIRQCVFDCDILEKIEGVFSTTIIVNCGGNVLQLEIAKASCPHISESNNNKIKLHIPMKHVFLMKDDV